MKTNPSNLSFQMQHSQLETNPSVCSQHCQHYNSFIDGKSYSQMPTSKSGMRVSLNYQDSAADCTNYNDNTTTMSLEKSYETKKEFHTAINALSVMSTSILEKTYEQQTNRLFDRIQKSRVENASSRNRKYLDFVNDLENDYFFFDNDGDFEEEDRSIHEQQEHVEDEGIFDLEM